MVAMRKMHATRPNSREDILDAAVRLAQREGSGRLTIDAVAREAGLSKGGVLYNFPTRDALIEGLAEMLLDRLDETVARYREQFDGQPNPVLKALIAANRERRVEDRPIVAAILAAATENPALLQAVRRRVAAHQRLVREEAADPTGATILWLAAGALMLYGVFGTLDIAQDHLDELDEALQARAAEA